MVKNKYVKILIIILIVLAVLGIFIYKKVIIDNNPDKEKIENLKTSIVEKSESAEVKKVLDFKSETCLPCKQMEVLLKELKDEFNGKVEIISIDIDEFHDIAGKYSIMYTPTVVFLDENDKEISRYVGFIGKSKLKKAIENGGKTDGNT